MIKKEFNRQRWRKILQREAEHGKQGKNKWKTTGCPEEDKPLGILGRLRLVLSVLPPSEIYHTWSSQAEALLYRRLFCVYFFASVFVTCDKAKTYKSPLDLGVSSESLPQAGTFSGTRSVHTLTWAK